MNKSVTIALALFSIFIIFVVDGKQDLTRKYNNYCFEKYESFDVINFENGFTCKADKEQTLENYETIKTSK